MGVSGSGKTTIGRLLAQRTGWPFLDADGLHPPANVAKMRGGIPLTDSDRRPWLEAVAAWVADRRAAGQPAIVGCSALKRAYRELLRQAAPDLRVVYLQGDRELLERRLVRRQGHFFPAHLLDAQLDDLEEPAPDEHPITVPIGGSEADTVDAIVKRLAG